MDRGDCRPGRLTRGDRRGLGSGRIARDRRTACGAPVDPGQLAIRDRRPSATTAIADADLGLLEELAVRRLGGPVRTELSSGARRSGPRSGRCPRPRPSIATATRARGARRLDRHRQPVAAALRDHVPTKRPSTAIAGRTIPPPGSSCFTYSGGEREVAVDVAEVVVVEGAEQPHHRRPRRPRGGRPSIEQLASLARARRRSARTRAARRAAAGPPSGRGRARSAGA